MISNTSYSRSTILDRIHDFWDQNFEEFFLAKSSMVNSSLISYFHLLNKFDGFLHEKQVTARMVKTKHCNEFMAPYAEHSMKTRKSYKIILQSFFSWLQEEGQISKNPAKKVIIQGDSRKKEKPQLTEDEFKKIALRCEGLRESTIVNFLWFTGVRAKEICSLKIDDINLIEKSLFVSVSKSSMGNRPIPIHRGLFILLKEYMDRRNSFLLDHDYLFINKRGGPLKYRTLLGLLARVSKGKFTTHSYRRGLITSVYNKTGDIVLAQQIAGHSSIKTTRGYIKGDKKRLEKFRSLDL